MNTQRVSLFLLAAIAVGLFSVAIDYAQPVLMPLVIAVLVSFVLAPAVEFLSRFKIPKVVAIILLILMILGVFFLVGLFFFNSIQSFVRIFPRYQQRLQELLDSVTQGLNERFGVPTDLLGGFDWSHMIRGYLISLSGGFIDFVTTLFIVTIFLIFLLLERPYMKRKLELAFEEQTSERIGLVIEHINQQIGRYLTLKLLISAATGFFIWISLRIIGMDFPVIWGFLGFVLNFIPSVGSTVHFVVTSVIGVVQFVPDESGKAVAVMVAMLAIQTLIGNILDPRLQGHRLDLSPFLVLFSLIFWGWLWGAVGMLLATPMTVAVKIVCENVPALRPLGVLMGKGYGRRPPALRGRANRAGSGD